MKVHHAAQTDVGVKRGHNEDSFLVNAELGLFIVCDGMGGHAGGETASRVAVAAIEQEVLEAQRRSPGTFTAHLPLAQSPLAGLVRNALEAACAAVFHAARANPALDGMGTTAVALLVQDSHAFVGHVGDSRVYMLRGERLQQLTEDHSWVQEQVRAGLLTEEQARTSRFKNIITRSIGSEEDVLVDVLAVSLEPGDRLLLCSDGLSNLVEDYELREILRTVALPQMPQTLIDLANARGGDDNITVIAVHAREDDAHAPG